MATINPTLHTNPSLVDYITQQAQVRTFGGSMQKHEHGYTMERRVIPDYNLLFVTRGRVVWDVAGHCHELVPQSLLLVPPGPEHHAYSLTKRLTLLSVHIRATLPGGVDLLELLKPQPLICVPRNSRLDGYLRGLLADYQGKSLFPNRNLLNGWTQLIAHAYLGIAAVNTVLAGRVIDPIIIAILEKLNENYAQMITLDQIAQWVGYTPQHTNRLFKQTLGVTALQYLMQIRMNKAASLLGENILSVHAVGQQVGFTDPYYFSRMFRQYHGRSPQQYQQMVCSESPS
jgi:AraC-like DNA-binding protein